MARDEDLSLVVLQGVGPFPIGLYQPSVLWRWFSLYILGVAALDDNISVENRASSVVASVDAGA